MSIHIDFSPVSFGVLAVVLFLSVKFFNAYQAKSKLGHIPTVGYNGLFTSYITALKWNTKATELIEEGYRLYPGGIFKVSTMEGWLVVVNGLKQVDEIRRASDDELDINEAKENALQAYYTIHPTISDHPYHTDVIRTPLTRNIGACFDDIHDEIRAVFSEKFPGTDDWTEVCAQESALDIIVRVANRFFVGLPLCRNEDFCDLNIKFTISIVVNSMIINIFPKILHPIIGRVFTERRSALRRAIKHLRPVIGQRLKMAEQYGKDWPDKPNDYLQWSMDAEQYAPLSQRTSVEDLSLRILAVNFVAIHSTSTTLTSALLNLASRPELAEPLRKEIENVVKKEGWTKVATVQMRLLDSFLRETGRLHMTNAISLKRKTVKDFQFSNGTTVPAGTWVSAASWPISRDEIFYPDSTEFKPFRFSDLRDRDGESIKYQFVNLALDWFIFGQGRHACPGRFFAAAEIKALMAQILLNYDVKFADDLRELPEQFRFQEILGPNREAKILFRKRR